MESGQTRVGSAGDLKGDPAAPALAALIDLLSTLQKSQQTTDTTQALPMLSEKVGQNAAAVFQVLPDVATDAVLALWEASRSVLEGAVGAGDTGAEQAIQVGDLGCQALDDSHESCWQRCGSCSLRRVPTSIMILQC